jgi:hypothetical protein
MYIYICMYNCMYISIRVYIYTYIYICDKKKKRGNATSKHLEIGQLKWEYGDVSKRLAQL